MLSETERRLSGCGPPDCDYRRLFDQLYYTIPEDIHAEYIDTLEVRLHEQRERIVSPIQFAAPYGELAAYPRRREFVDEPEVYRNAIDPDSAGIKVEVDPPVLDMGIM